MSISMLNTLFPRALVGSNPARITSEFRILSALGLAMMLPFVAHAQTESAADAAWQEVMVAGAPVASARSATITKEEAAADQKSQATRFVRASEKARQFYQNFPSHPKAAEAKRLEVVGLLRAVQTGDVTVEHKAERLAREFESNIGQSKTRPLCGRFAGQADAGAKEADQDNGGDGGCL